MGWGEVLGLGHGHYTDIGIVPLEGLKVGDRVAFVKFLKEAHTNKAVQQTLGEDELIIRMEDVVVVDSK